MVLCWRQLSVNMLIDCRVFSPCWEDCPNVGILNYTNHNVLLNLRKKLKIFHRVAAMVSWSWSVCSWSSRYSYAYKFYIWFDYLAALQALWMCSNFPFFWLPRYKDVPRGWFWCLGTLDSNQMIATEWFLVNSDFRDHRHSWFTEKSELYLLWFIVSTDHRRTNFR